MNIILRENQFNLVLRRMLSEMIYSNNTNLLMEGDSRLKKIITQIMPNAFNGLLDVNTQVSGPEYYINNNPNTTWGEYLLFNLRHTLGLMGNSDVPLLLYIAPIAWGDEVKFDKTNDNDTQVAELLQICQLLKKDKALFEKAKSTCGSFSELHDLCAPVLEELKNAEDAEINNGDYTSDNGYEIKKVDFNEAFEIGEYSSLQRSGKLCYTQSKSTWDSYTNDGKNTVYVCLKDGWKDMKPEPGPNAPYDEYGLSMIFVFVDPKNNIAYSNTRWNHEHSDNISVDHAFTKAQLSQIVGCNFYDVFKSDNPALPPQQLTALAEQIYNSGETDKFQAFWKANNNLKSVQFHDVCNFININTGKIIFPDMWFDGIRYVRTGHIRVELNDKWNVVTPEGELLWKGEWFDWIDNNRSGYFGVRLNHKYNLLTNEGNLLWQGDWFDDISFYEDGTIEVKVDGKFNILTPEGTLLWQGDWFDWMIPCKNGYFKVRLNNKYNLLTNEGNLLWQGDWFDSLYRTTWDNEEVYFVGYRKFGTEQYNVLTYSGELVFPRWFEMAGVVADLWKIRFEGDTDIKYWNPYNNTFEDYQEDDE